jgi:hypothetical protein
MRIKRLNDERVADRGSVLMLIPAGFLVVIILAALAVDSAATYLAQQQLHDALAAAANDAVTAGVSNSSFYSSGAVRLDPSLVGRAVCLSMAAQSDQNLHGLRLWMAVDGATVTLQGTASVEAVFGRAIPGFGRRHVKADAQAVVTGRQLVAPPSPTVSPGPLVPLNCL